MIEVLQFVFQSFWHWLGTLVLLCVVAAVVCDVASSAKRDP